jgi:hypothetical protein
MTSGRTLLATLSRNRTHFNTNGRLWAKPNKARRTWTMRHCRLHSAGCAYEPKLASPRAKGRGRRRLRCPRSLTTSKTSDLHPRSERRLLGPRPTYQSFTCTNH